MRTANGKESEEIKLLDCAELVAGGVHEQYGRKFANVFNFEQIVKEGSKESDFLCPFNQQKLEIEGEFG